MNSRRRVNSDVMRHRYLMNGLAAAQYLSYLLVGALYFLIFGAIAGVAAGIGLVGLGLVYLPLLLGGYVSGLSFFMPRLAAIAALVIGIPLLLLGISDIFRGSISAEPFLVIPWAIVIAVSICVLLWTNGSIWRRLTTRFDKIGIGIFAALPAAFATWCFVLFIRFLLTAT
jgi:hypothetical protein